MNLTAETVDYFTLEQEYGNHHRTSEVAGESRSLP